MSTPPPSLVPGPQPPSSSGGSRLTRMNLEVTVMKSSICVWHAEANEAIKGPLKSPLSPIGIGRHHVQHDEKETEQG